HAEVERRPHHRPRAGARRVVHEPPVPRPRRAARGPGPHHPRRSWCAQGPCHGREFAAAMKILVIGLDCAAPALLFGDERLENFRRLMDAGCYGRLESVIPPITVPAWMCMATSQDPG